MDIARQVRHVRKAGLICLNGAPKLEISPGTDGYRTEQLIAKQYVELIAKFLWRRRCRDISSTLTNSIPTRTAPSFQTLRLLAGKRCFRPARCLQNGSFWARTTSPQGS